MASKIKIYFKINKDNYHFHYPLHLTMFQSSEVKQSHRNVVIEIQTWSYAVDYVYLKGTATLIITVLYIKYLNKP